ncbi:hypothetical protein BDP81DRAFT_199681 [Colletotrichum phormii]|uniref:Heterokaryon incompatibility domain-containing protein n=1 Tax=Colletotrichum phormii TaxID=359342 RepID=A0AAI9ZW50_9PEZI|nr:uncharacterized protein BDP81DRAFT_199681 [Colletotrichum phormii]KAK1639271.1 hypothetical protein BDP81DRAFT_199681 [Colletotrichum phormii]
MSIRLIDTETLQLKAFASSHAPAYAILSHTWAENEEVSVGIHVSRATVRLERSVNNGLLLLRPEVEGGDCGQSPRSPRSVSFCQAHPSTLVTTIVTLCL